MHFNDNFGRAQAITKSGMNLIQLTFPKDKMVFPSKSEDYAGHQYLPATP